MLSYAEFQELLLVSELRGSSCAYGKALSRRGFLAWISLTLGH